MGYGAVAADHRAGMTGQSRAGEAFWRFSLTFYGRPGVAEALLLLQDRAGCDVNLILFGLWLGAVCGIQAEAGPDRAVPLRGIAEELRRLRRRLKADPDPAIQDLRRRVAVLELAAERAVQYRLTSLAGGAADIAADTSARLAAAEANLAEYLGEDVAASDAAARLRAALADFIRR